MTETIEVPALALQQSSGRCIYAFGVDGKTVPDFASVQRAGRAEDGKLIGYQRPEVRRHIAEIRGYLESEQPMVPNALVLAFDERVEFVPQGPKNGSLSTSGTLRIPLGDDPELGRVGWIVDGQQRVAAIREASIDSFPMFAVAFIATETSEAREQFLLVNNTKPLPRGLIYELLPGVDARLPSHLAKRRIPAALVEILNYDKESPLHLAITTATNPGARIKDNSLLRFLENSLSDGVLYRIRLVERETWQDATKVVLFSFWRAVRNTWPELWDLPPKKSRLLHGAGVVTLGFLMDAIADRYRAEGWPTADLFAEELALIKPYCRWNEGYWDFGNNVQRKWNEIQNTSKDVTMLANHLLRIYLRICAGLPVN